MATIATKYTDRMSWPVDRNTFAAAVDHGKSAGNQLARGFYTADCATGRWAPDFDRMLSLLHSAEQIEYRTSALNRFWVLVGRRFADRILQCAPPGDRADAVALVRIWLEFATGERCSE